MHYKIKLLKKEDEEIWQVANLLVSIQEYYNIDLMPEIMAIAKKIGATQ